MWASTVAINIYMWQYQGEFSALHRWNLSLNNLSLFHCAAVKINSIVILSGIDWVWNCNQTATITLNQTDTTGIYDVYKSPWNSVYIVILLVSVKVYYGKCSSHEMRKQSWLPQWAIIAFHMLFVTDFTAWIYLINQIMSDSFSKQLKHDTLVPKS